MATITEKYIKAQEKLTEIMNIKLDIIFTGKTVYSVKADFNREVVVFIFTDGTVAEMTTYKGDDELQINRKVEP